MFRHVLTTALAGAAITVAAPAVAQKVGANINAGATVNVPPVGATVNVPPVGATVNVPPVDANARVNSQGAVNASPEAQIKANENSAVQTQVTPNANVNANVNSQGAANASVNGVVHASPNSVHAKGSVAATALPGLATGLTVKNSGGTSIGTVSQIVAGADGSIRAVIVTNAQGQKIRLMPNTLTISAGVVTTTSATL